MQEKQEFRCQERQLARRLRSRGALEKLRPVPSKTNEHSFPGLRKDRGRMEKISAQVGKGSALLADSL